MASPRKFIVRIEVPNDVASALNMVTDKRGMTQLSLVSRLVKWIGQQDAETQVEILNGSDKNSSQGLLKRLASHASKE
jgi:hypothetical protein